MRSVVLICLINIGILLMGFGTALAAPVPEPFIIGKARVTALQDMPGEMPLSIFRGADMETMKAQVPSGSAPAGVTVFLIQIGDRNIVVDTGFGINTPERKSALPELLRHIGLEAGDIDLVLLSHMHGDHVGGLVQNGAAAFPKASIMVSEKELAFWTDPKTLRENPGLDGNIRQVTDMQKAYGNKVKTFAFNDAPAPGMTALGATGHTLGHTMFLLTSEGNRMLFWGDLVHAEALQFANPDICALYDMAMPEAVATRREVFAMATKEAIPVAGAHLPYPAVGLVSKEAGSAGYIFKPGL